MTMELYGDYSVWQYSVPTFISFLNLKIFNTDHALPTDSKNFDRHHFILT